MTRFELQVRVNEKEYYLDTFEGAPIDITYNISDIADIASRNSSYSKTISLPDSDHNRQVFGFISDLSASSTFNPNLKSKAYILVDTLPVFEGNLQLKEVVYNEDLGYNTFECVIFADNDNFFTSLGDRELTDLDLSDLSHRYNAASVTQSWTNTYGYYYPLIDYGRGWQFSDLNGSIGLTQAGATSTPYIKQLRVSDFYPATYVSTYVDRIFQQAGYSYQSNFFRTDTFKNLIIPFNRTALTRTPGFEQNKIFYVGYSTGQSIPNPYNPNYFNQNGILLSSPLKFNNTTTPPYGDPNGLWTATSSFVYTNTQPNYPFKQRFTVGVDINNVLGISTTVVKDIRVTVYRQFFPGTTTIYPDWNSNPKRGYPIPTSTGDTSFILWDINGNNNLPDGVQVNGNRISAQFTTDWLDNRTLIFANNPNNCLAPNEQVRVVLDFTTRFGSDTTVTISNLSYFYNEVSLDVVPKMLLDYNQTIPLKVKQKDFIASLIKMFNLYIEPSKDYPKTLLIEPRDDYYKNGSVKDWSSKVDLLEPPQVQILAETQNRQTLFSFKDDKDYYNSYYKSSWNEIYGQEIYSIENDFLTGTKNVDVIFSPTPLVKLYNNAQSGNIVIPVIAKEFVNSTPAPTGRIENNIRILTKSTSGLVTFTGTASLNVGASASIFFESTSYNRYPYAGHLDNPFTPTYDINFGQVKRTFYPTTTFTSNNLVQIYWMNTLEELGDVDSRLVTVSMYLDAQDINQFKFSDSIYLSLNSNSIGGGGHYYKVNKISGYDPASAKPCKVELIRSLTTQINRTKPSNTGGGNGTGGGSSTGSGTSTSASSTYASSPSSFTSGISTQANNSTLASAFIVNGQYNSINSSGALVTGSFNRIAVNSPQATISGSNNVINYGANNAFIMGNNNTVAAGVNNAVIIGNGITARQSNMIYSTTPSVQYFNVIDAGDGDIIGQFSSSVINVIDGGKNAIRGIGSGTVINLIDGNEDDV